MHDTSGCALVPITKWSKDHLVFIYYFNEVVFHVCGIIVYRDEMEEVEIEMEIGFPTDVKHVTHIGLDGSTMTNPVKGWDNLAMSMAPEILTFPSLSLRQFELAMAAQSAADDHIHATKPVMLDPAQFSQKTTVRIS